MFLSVKCSKMDAKDRMVGMILISYLFMFIGIVAVVAYVLHWCGLSSEDSRNYAIGGTGIFVIAAWFWLTKKNDNEFKHVRNSDHYSTR